MRHPLRVRRDLIFKDQGVKGALFAGFPLHMQTPPRRGQDHTERELEVLQLMARGLTNAHIARRLVVSHATANFHVGSILSKLGVHSPTRADSSPERPARTRAIPREHAKAIRTSVTVDSRPGGLARPIGSKTGHTWSADQANDYPS
jgi:DNA-binding NarL/FixJ family response regulator